MSNYPAGPAFAFRLSLLAALLVPAALGARAQTTQPGQEPDGSKARALLGLQPRHASISVADLQAETRWYVEKLGFSLPATPPMNGGPGGKIKGVQLTMPGYQMHMIQYEGSQRAPIPSPVFLSQGWIHVAFSVADINQAYRFLKSSGTDVKAMNDRNGKTGTLVLHDPEGNEIELFAR